MMPRARPSFGSMNQLVGIVCGLATWGSGPATPPLSMSRYDGWTVPVAGSMVRYKSIDDAGADGMATALTAPGLGTPPTSARAWMPGEPPLAVATTLK